MLNIFYKKFFTQTNHITLCSGAYTPLEPFELSQNESLKGSSNY